MILNRPKHLQQRLPQPQTVRPPPHLSHRSLVPRPVVLQPALGFHAPRHLAQRHLSPEGQIIHISEQTTTVNSAR